MFRNVHEEGFGIKGNEKRKENTLMDTITQKVIDFPSPKVIKLTLGGIDVTLTRGMDGALRIDVRGENGWRDVGGRVEAELLRKLIFPEESESEVMKLERVSTAMFNALIDVLTYCAKAETENQRDAMKGARDALKGWVSLKAKGERG